MLNIHGYSLLFVKDAISKHSTMLDITITRSLLENVKDSRKWSWLTWKLREPLKKKRKQKENKLEAKKKDEKMKSQEILVLTASLEQLQNSLTVADDSVKEGNEHIKQLLTQEKLY